MTWNEAAWAAAVEARFGACENCANRGGGFVVVWGTDGALDSVSVFCTATGAQEQPPARCADFAPAC